MSDSYEDLERKLVEMRAGYAEHLPSRIEKLSAQWQQLKSKPGHMEEKETVIRETHNLAGTGESFGFSKVSKVSRELEQVLNKLWKGGDDEQLEVAKGLFLQLTHYGSQDADTESMEAPIMNPKVAGKNWSADKTNRILLVEDGKEFADELLLHLEYFGYEITLLNSPENLVEKVRELSPAVIIMDIMFPSGKDAGLEAVSQLKMGMLAVPPVIFLSVRDDIMARLEAVRAGGAAYYQKPADLYELTETLDRITTPQEEFPYRILVVDDDITYAEQTMLELKRAGMEALCITDPMKVNLSLAEFRPELILMDLHMPQCNGIELAAVIRQQPTYLGMPIVFLSADVDVKNHLEALRQGGDDFLIKPIAPDHLVTAVYARARRARQLRAAMVRDSLTGLLNHRNIGEQLGRDIARSKRSGNPVSYALVDLDNFKQVNDTYGHGVGDQVLVAVSRLLRKRFRNTDTLGRYGGEEFAIIMPDTDIDQAEDILNDIREKFALIQHSSDKGSFRLTFSAGISAFPACKSPSMLVKAADEALYWAKEKGRNRVRKAEVCNKDEKKG